MTTVEHDGVVRARRAGARRALHPLGYGWASVCARARAAAVAARALPARAGRDAPPAYTCSATVAAAVLSVLEIYWYHTGMDRFSD